MSYLKAEQVEWITNDNGELGVKIGDQFFFLYKGHSLVYESGLHDNGTPMHWRPVGKREFGECAYPINHDDYSKIGTVSLGDSDLWKQMPPAQQPAAAPVSGDVALPELPSREIRDLVRSVYDKAYENGRADAIAKNCSRYIGRRVEDEQGNQIETIARTYGQQCSDAALERAAKVCAAYGTTQGNYLASAIRSLKGSE